MIRRNAFGGRGRRPGALAAVAAGAPVARQDEGRLRLRRPGRRPRLDLRHDLGRQAIEKKFGDKVETTFVENVAEGPDAERVIRQMARPATT